MAKKKKIKSPTQLELVEPTFSSFVELGGSATISEIYERVVAMLNMHDSVIDALRKGMLHSKQNWSISLHGQEHG